MKDLGAYTKALIASLIFCIFGAIAMLASAVMLIRFDADDREAFKLDYAFVDYDAHAARGQFIVDSHAISGFAFYLFFIITAVLTSMWMYRATFNLKTVRLPRMNVAPVFAAFWWYVPVAHFAMPFVAMTQIFKGSKHCVEGHRDGQWRNETMSWMLPIWWTLWILSIFIDSSEYNTAISNTTYAEMAETAWVEVGVSIMRAIAALFLLLIVRKVGKWQATMRDMNLDYSHIPSGQGVMQSTVGFWT